MGESKSTDREGELAGLTEALVELQKRVAGLGRQLMIVEARLKSFVTALEDVPDEDGDMGR